MLRIQPLILPGTTEQLEIPVLKKSVYCVKCGDMGPEVSTVLRISLIK
jgi:hypothetical protein